MSFVSAFGSRITSERVIVPHALSACTFSPSAASLRYFMSFFSRDRRYHASALFFLSASRRILSRDLSRYSRRMSAVSLSLGGRSASLATTARMNCWSGRPAAASAATISAASAYSLGLPAEREFRRRTIALDDLSSADAKRASSASENVNAFLVTSERPPSLPLWPCP